MLGDPERGDVAMVRVTETPRNLADPQDAAELIEAGQSYPLRLPDRSYAAAAAILKALEAESNRHGLNRACNG